MKKKGPNRAKGPWDPKKQMRFDFEYAKQMIVQDNGLMPMFVVHSKQGTIPIGFGGKAEYEGEAKVGHRRIAVLMGIAFNAVAIAYVGEAWIATSLPDEPEPEYPRVRPKDREDRKEVIITQMMWRDQETGERKAALAQAEIVRNAKGVCTGVKDEEFTEPTDKIVGNFSELLLEREPTIAEQEIAQKILAAMGTELPRWTN